MPETIRGPWTPLLAIVKSTICGYIRERVLVIVVVFAFILMMSSYVLAPLAVGAQKKIIVDVGLASISLFGVLLVILLGAGSYSREKDKGILPSLLAKPISRFEYLVGRYVGTVTTIAIVMVVMALVYLGVMWASRTTVTQTMLQAMYLSVIEIALLTSVLTFFSTFSSPVLCSFFTLCVFISGHLSKDLLAFAEHFGSPPLQVMSTVFYYVLPNMSLFDIRSEAVHGIPLMNQYVQSVTIYAVCFTIFLLYMSLIRFGRRDVT